MIVIPLLEGISSIIQQIAEFIMTKIAVHTYNLKKLLETAEDQSEIETHVIGFQAPTQLEEDAEEYDPGYGE